MNKSKWHPRGGKLFLPKLEYGSLANGSNRATTTNFKKENAKIDEFIFRNDREELQLETEVGPHGEKEKSTGAFTKFAVLPPIQDRFSSNRTSPRRMSRIRRPSNFKTEALDKLKDSRTDQEITASRKGNVQQQGITTNKNQIDVFKNSNSSALKIVGKKYIGLGKGELRSEDTENGTPQKLLQRPSSTPNAGLEQSLCSNCGGLQPNGVNPSKAADYHSGSPMEPSTVPRYATRRGSYLRRINSDTSPTAKATEKSTQSLCACGDKSNTNNLRRAGTQGVKASTLVIPGSNGLLGRKASPRPLSAVSGCHVDIKMSELEFNKQGIQRGEFHLESVSSETKSIEAEAPLIHISMSMENEHFSSGIKTKAEEDSPPQIQLLIDSLDNAKEELPKGKMELPKMSVREKRRRSALCRVKSKQVDDFLLVHNLRDLGLL